jgi:5-methylcytosine-specific restriction endonuclease McrA
LRTTEHGYVVRKSFYKFTRMTPSDSLIFRVGMLLQSVTTKSRRLMSRKRHKVDFEATAHAGFQDKRSYCTVDDREFLFGLDMQIMRKAVLGRCGYGCSECGSPVQLEVHHIQPRGRGGDDSERNLTALCGSCHRSRHVRPKLHWMKPQETR